MKCVLMLFAAVIAMPFAYGNPAEQSAKTFVEKLYASYSQPDAPSPLGKSADRIFTPLLLSKIRADQNAYPGEVGKLDHDPLCDCQDTDGVKNVKINVTSLPDGRADAAVHFELNKTAKSLHLRLAHISHQWKIDDVHTVLVPSLQKFLVNQSEMSLRK